MEEHNIINEKETKHKQYECPCCTIMIGLHNKARHERTKRHKDNLITDKEETKTEAKTETQFNVEPVNDICERLEYMTMVSGDCF